MLALTKTERNYCVTRKELLAVVAFLQHFHPFLLGVPFTIRTGHGALMWIQRFKEPESQIARWLQEYQFSIIHCPGIAPADENSTVTVTSPDKSPLCKYSLRATQLDDPCIEPLLRCKETGQPPHTLDSTTTEGHRLQQLWDQLTVHNGLLCRQSNQAQSWLQLVPSS